MLYELVRVDGSRAAFPTRGAALTDAQWGDEVWETSEDGWRRLVNTVRATNPHEFTPEIKLEKADDRGEIYSIGLPDGTEFMLIHSVKGSLRGGHSHDVPESVMLLTGKMDHVGGDDWVEFIRAGDSYNNATGEIHMGRFTKDSWLVEVKPGTPAHTAVDTDYEPFRKRVREQS